MRKAWNHVKGSSIVPATLDILARTLHIFRLTAARLTRRVLERLLSWRSEPPVAARNLVLFGAARCHGR